MLRLEIPNTSHEKEYMEMIKEWRGLEGTSTWPSRLFAGENFQDFLIEIRKDVVDNYRGVNSTLFFLMEEDKILGAIQVRHHIDHPNLKEAGWHIGYGIRPKERRKWYATKMLELWLIEAKNLWINKILISCDDDNIASEKVIINNGWIFRKEVEKDWELLKTYWITL